MATLLLSLLLITRNYEDTQKSYKPEPTSKICENFETEKYDSIDCPIRERGIPLSVIIASLGLCLIPWYSNGSVTIASVFGGILTSKQSVYYKSKQTNNNKQYLIIKVNEMKRNRKDTVLF